MAESRKYKFTSGEWRYLARGARLLAQKDGENYERRKSSSLAEWSLEFQRLHEEMAELCDYWGGRADGAPKGKDTCRKFGGTELRDLARGCRLMLDNEVERASERVELTELAKLCERYADDVDHANWVSSRELSS